MRVRTGKPTLPTAFRSVDPNITGGKDDVFATSPWRSPGSAKVTMQSCAPRLRRGLSLSLLARPHRALCVFFYPHVLV